MNTEPIGMAAYINPIDNFNTGVIWNHTLLTAQNPTLIRNKSIAHTIRFSIVCNIFCFSSLILFFKNSSPTSEPFRIQIAAPKNVLQINKYLEKTIGELGDSLPEHKIVLYK